jgi:hypothetical protein
MDVEACGQSRGGELDFFSEDRLITASCAQVEAEHCRAELPPLFAALASLLLLFRRHGLPFLLFGRVIFRLFL